MPRFTKETPTAFHNMTEERQREIAKIGNEKSQESKRMKKTMKEIMKMLLEEKPTQQEVDAVRNFLPTLDVDEINKTTVMLFRQLQKAISKGDTKAATFVRDTAGEKPVETFELTPNEKTVYITPDMDSETQKHIESMINNDGDR